MRSFIHHHPQEQIHDAKMQADTLKLALEQAVNERTQVEKDLEDKFVFDLLHLNSQLAIG